jgi:hypothetical protein
MLALNIAKFLIFLGLGVMLINGMGIFNNTYISTDPTIYNDFTLSNVANYNLPEQPSIVDYFMMVVTWAWQGITMLFKLIMVPLKVLPWAMNAFGIPQMIQTVLIVGVTMAIILAILQWYSNKSTEAYE